MPIFNQVITLEQAIAREHDTWEVFVGTFGSGDDTLYPIITAESLPSVAAVAIGPRSQVDRCWVLWDPQVVITVPGAVKLDYLRRLTRHAPLMFPQFGKKNISAAPLGPNSGLRFSADPALLGVSPRYDNGSLIVPANFYPHDSIVEQPFTILPIGGQNPTRQPYLHLVFYLKPPLHTPPKERYPFQNNTGGMFNLAPPSGSPLADVWVFQGALPVHGRRQTNFEFSVNSANVLTYDVRIGGIKNGNGSSIIPKEVWIDTTVVGVSQTAPRYLQIQDVGFDYLTIWGSRQTGGDPTGQLLVWTED